MPDTFNIESLLNIDESNKILTIKPISDITLQIGHHLENFTKTINNDVSKIVVDLSQIARYDSFLVLFLSSLKTYSIENNAEFEIRNQSEDIRNFYERFQFDEKEDEAKKKEKSTKIILEKIGNKTLDNFNENYNFLEFLGNIVIKLFKAIFKPSLIRWEDFPYQFTRAAIGAVPITLLIVFLIGIISGYQGAIQFKKYGADIYVADLVGVSITRELAPLMVSILVTGRSGSAFAAEIGTMKVSEEIDAMKSMGFDIFGFLILPRVIAVTLAVPMLTMMADVAGVIGGLVSALSSLNITITGYFNELQKVLWYSDILTGLLKSLVFGFVIAMIGCYKGLQVSGGAESVGKFTTSSVVNGVFMIIFLNAIFTYIFQMMGI